MGAVHLRNATVDKLLDGYLLIAYLGGLHLHMRLGARGPDRDANLGLHSGLRLWVLHGEGHGRVLLVDLSRGDDDLDSAARGLRRWILLRRLHVHLHLHLGILRGVGLLLVAILRLLLRLLLWLLWRSVWDILAVRIALRRPVVSRIHGRVFFEASELTRSRCVFVASRINAGR